MEMLQVHDTGEIGEGLNYSIIGELSKHPAISAIMRRSLRDKSLYGDCIGKAEYVYLALSRSGIKLPSVEVVMGEFFVYNADMSAKYGFKYNIDRIPREFHAWVEVGDMVIDSALPGVILRGLQMVDQYGSILEGRSPVMLAGKSPNWCSYLKKETYNEFLNRQ